MAFIGPILKIDQKMNVLANMGHFINAYVSVNVQLSKRQGIDAWLSIYPDV